MPVLLMAAALALSACGDDTTSPVTATTTPPSATASVAAPPGSVQEVTVGDLTFAVRTAGPEDGEPVVLLHGFPETAAMWRSQIDALAAEGYRVVAPDQRGYSAGARPEQVDAYRVDRLVGDVTDLADTLGFERFHLIGHDWGGAVAWATAGLHPDRLLSLTSVSTPHLTALAEAYADPTTGQAQQSAYVDTFVAPGSEQLFLADDAALLRSLYDEAGLDAAEAQVHLDVLADQAAMRAALDWYRANDLTAGTALGAIEVPTLYVWGTEDQALGRAAAEATGDFVTGPYRFEPLEGVNHWVPEVAADGLDALLVEFLAEPGG
jgi:pimeloyl-ACP methyl ester carboxylesterase